jgi:hypothetical protein
VCGNRGIEAFGPDVSQRSECSYFIGTYEPRVTDHIGGQDGSKAALSAFFGHLEQPLPEGAVQQIVSGSHYQSMGLKSASGQPATWPGGERRSGLAPIADPDYMSPRVS